jgi:hypothetical protein
MRSLWFVILFFSTSAFSCPNLAGHYKECRPTTGNSSGSYDMVVSQIVQDNVTIYTVTATDARTQERVKEVYRTDGSTHVTEYNDPQSGTLLKTTTTAFCLGNELNIKGEIFIMEESILQYDVKVKKSGNQLIISSVYRSQGDEKSDEAICE